MLKEFLYQIMPLQLKIYVPDKKTRDQTVRLKNFKMRVKENE